MFLKCEVIIHNRLAPALESKKSYATFIFSKKISKSGEAVYFTIHSPKKKEGSIYMVIIYNLWGGGGGGGIFF